MCFRRALLLSCLILALVGCKHEQEIEPAEAFSDDLKARMTAGAEKYRLEAWKARSIEVSEEPIVLSPSNTTLRIAGFLSNTFPSQRQAIFMRLAGKLKVRPQDSAFESLELDVDASSITAPQESWHALIRGEKMLHVAEFPQIKFVSKSVEAGEVSGERKRKYIVHGELTVHGQTQEMKLPMEMEFSDNRCSLFCQFGFDRSQFEITGFQGVIANQVDVFLEVPRQAEMVVDDTIATSPPTPPGPSAPGGGGGGNFDPEQFFKERDADGDGKLSGEEIPERMRERVADIDTDKDGAVSLEEFRNRPRRGGGPGGPPPATREGDSRPQRPETES